MSDSVQALSIVYEDVKQRLIDDGPIGVVVTFGRRERTKQINQGTGRANRVVFQPGDDGSGKMGTYAPPRNPGRLPRPLFTLREIAYVYCWAYDPTDPNNEQLQYEAAKLLHDQVLRAIYKSRVGHGTIQVKDPTLQAQKTERLFGYEIRFTLELESMVPDSPGIWPEATGVAPTAIDVQNTAKVPDDSADGIDHVEGDET